MMTKSVISDAPICLFSEKSGVGMLAFQAFDYGEGDPLAFITEAVGGKGDFEGGGRTA
jgi:hypothetical protein